MRIVRSLFLAVALLVFAPAQAGAQQLPIVIVPGLELADLERLSERAAVGLLVPGAGPETSAELARAALVRGQARNSLRGGLPSGRPLVRVETSSGVPPGSAIVLALPSGPRQPNDRRYPVAVIADGYRGLLESDSTRLPGLVSIVDIAPTALGATGALDSRGADNPVATLRDLDRRIDENGNSRLPASLIAAALIVVLALVFPRAAVLAFATGPAANLLLGAAEISSPWLVLPALALSIAVLAPIVAVVVRSPPAIGLILVAVIAVYLIAMALDASAVALSPLGPSQNARFYGISNLLETMLLVPTLVGAAVFGRRFGWLGFGLVAVLALVTIAGSRFGADGGGAIVLVAGLAVLAVLLGGGSRRRWLAAFMLAAAALGVVALDALLGPSTHVGRSLAEGDLASDLGERVELSWERATSSAIVAVVVAAALLVLIALVARGSRRALPLAFAAAIAASLVVNDSPGDVAVGGIVGYLTLARFTSPRSYNRSTPSRGAELSMKRKAFGRDAGLSARMLLTGGLLGLLYVIFAVVLFNVLSVGLIPMLVIVIGLAFFQYYTSDKLALLASGAKVVERDEAPQLHDMVERLCALADLPKPKVAVIDTDVPNAFATGRSPKHAAVAVTNGLWRRLEPREVEGVLAHELAHIANRDVLVMTLASFFAMLAGLLARFGLYGGMFGGGDRNRDGGAPVWLIIFAVSIVTYILSFVLIRTISRYREYSADRGAALVTGAPEYLMSALQRISSGMATIPQRDLREVEAMNAFFIIPTGVKSTVGELFATHPPLEKRLERLAAIAREMGRPVR